MTPHEVAGRLTWTRREVGFADLDHFNQAMATLETRAHLEALVQQTRGRRVAEPSALLYIAR